MTDREPIKKAEHVYVGMGSNLGDRLSHLQEGVRRLDATEQTEVHGVSKVYETEAHRLPGQAPQPDHLNAVVLIKTALSPFQLLKRLKEIERAAGRDPSTERWAPRDLDLDILVFGDRILSTENLEIPHPRITERRFVLEPFCELAPNLILPGTNETIQRLLLDCRDTAGVIRTSLLLTN